MVGIDQEPHTWFHAQTPKEMFTHLCGHVADLDCIVIAELTTLMNNPWKVTENLASIFSHDDKYEKRWKKQALRLSYLFVFDIGQEFFHSHR